MFLKTLLFLGSMLFLVLYMFISTPLVLNMFIRPRLILNMFLNALSYKTLPHFHEKRILRLPLFILSRRERIKVQRKCIIICITLLAALEFMCNTPKASLRQTLLKKKLRRMVASCE